MKAKELETLRVATGLTRNEAALRLGIPLRTYARWESGARPILFAGLLTDALRSLLYEIQIETIGRKNEGGRVSAASETGGIDTRGISHPLAGGNFDHLQVGIRQDRSSLPNRREISLQRNSERKERGTCMIVAIFNQSGGVGKSTLTRDLGYDLAQRGLRLLLVDADPQGTLGMFLGLSPGELQRSETFWDVVASPQTTPDIRPPIIQTEFGLNLALANRTLVDLELTLAQHRNTARLLSFLRQLSPDYDLILIDCSPKISEVTIQALMAADGLLVPVQTEAKSVSAFFEVQFEITRAKRRRLDVFLPAFEVVGVVPTLHDPRLILHRHHLRELKDEMCAQFGYPVLPPVRNYVAVSEAGTQRMPLKMYDPKCPANDDVTLVADRILAAFGIREVKRANG